MKVLKILSSGKCSVLVVSGGWQADAMDDIRAAGEIHRCSSITIPRSLIHDNARQRAPIAGVFSPHLAHVI